MQAEARRAGCGQRAAGSGRRAAGRRPPGCPRLPPRSAMPRPGKELGAGLRVPLPFPTRLAQGCLPPTPSGIEIVHFGARSGINLCFSRCAYLHPKPLAPGTAPPSRLPAPPPRFRETTGSSAPPGTSPPGAAAWAAEVPGPPPPRERGPGGGRVRCLPTALLVTVLPDASLPRRDYFAKRNKRQRAAPAKLSTRPRRAPHGSPRPRISPSPRVVLPPAPRLCLPPAALCPGRAAPGPLPEPEPPGTASRAGPPRPGRRHGHLPALFPPPPGLPRRRGAAPLRSPPGRALGPAAALGDGGARPRVTHQGEGEGNPRPDKWHKDGLLPPLPPALLPGSSGLPAAEAGKAPGGGPTCRRAAGAGNPAGAFPGPASPPGPERTTQPTGRPRPGCPRPPQSSPAPGLGGSARARTPAGAGRGYLRTRTQFMLPSATTGERPQQTPTDPGRLEEPGAGLGGAGKPGVQTGRHPSPPIWEAAAPPGSPRSRTGLLGTGVGTRGTAKVRPGPIRLQPRSRPGPQAGRRGPGPALPGPNRGESGSPAAGTGRASGQVRCPPRGALRALPTAPPTPRTNYLVTYGHGITHVYSAGKPPAENRGRPGLRSPRPPNAASPLLPAPPKAQPRPRRRPPPRQRPGTEAPADHRLPGKGSPRQRPGRDRGSDRQNRVPRTRVGRRPSSPGGGRPGLCRSTARTPMGGRGRLWGSRGQQAVMPSCRFASPWEVPGFCP
ncbi:basic proline-rich protein-like [Harpia harpyja]|uniref:basic proline-rich protein-like n=1 Tax=Harpia harpyja TaxID=202280 RepID=UPI0022B0AF84|nr:basic proline-rich protein-like [Harpia harpyja]